jgi:hypothetical protein
VYYLRSANLEVASSSPVAEMGLLLMKILLLTDFHSAGIPVAFIHTRIPVRHYAEDLI